CPYKVRRFNFFQYSKPNEPTYLLGKNPDVTVRERGVMEKCTYCVQRINGARIELKKLEVRYDRSGSNEDKIAVRAQRDAVMRGLETACQQSCPTEAIIFGDLNFQDQQGKRTQVAALHAQPRDFGLLEELNTKPRTRYLPRVINPNTKLHG